MACFFSFCHSKVQMLLIFSKKIARMCILTSTSTSTSSHPLCRTFLLNPLLMKMNIFTILSDITPNEMLHNHKKDKLSHKVFFLFLARYCALSSSCRVLLWTKRQSCRRKQCWIPDRGQKVQQCFYWPIKFKNKYIFSKFLEGEKNVNKIRKLKTKYKLIIINILYPLEWFTISLKNHSEWYIITLCTKLHIHIITL